MKSPGKKTIIIVLCILAAMPILYLGGRSFMLDHIREKLEEQIYRLRDAGYIVNYDSITINWQKNTVDIFQLSVKHDLDSALCSEPDFIYAKHIKAKGFRVMPLIFKRHLSFSYIEVDSPTVFVNETFLDKDSSQRKRKEFTFIIDKLSLPTLHFRYYDSKSCVVRSDYTANARVEDFTLAFYEDQPMFINISSLSSDSIRVEIPEDYYALTIKEITFKPELGIFDMDTLRIIPYHSKIAFGRKKGYETDRIEGIVPYLNVYGLSLDRRDSLTITAKKITTQMFLRVFRDKRLPFRKKYKHLPVEALYALPLGLNVETVVVNKSFVEYEEFAEEADSSGSVFFDDMYATIHHVSNVDPEKKGKTRMTAEAAFMGQGKIKVNAVMPWNPRIDHHVYGTIQNMEMTRLNQMIEPAIQVRAESGHLNQLSFDFKGDNNQSNGELQLNYTNLKLTTFKTEDRIEKILRKKKRKNEKETTDVDDDEKIRKASFKTFIVNTFIIRRDMDKDVPLDKRTGKVAFERDKNKSVFNYWAKSILSGVKSAYNIDKIQDSKLSKLLKKKDKDKG